MDGYIQNKRHKIKMERQAILWSYCYTFPIALFILTFMFILVVTPPPEKWETVQVVYYRVSEHRVSRGPDRVIFHTTDGQEYQINATDYTFDEANRVLNRGQTYLLTYSPSILYKNVMALSTEEEILISLEESLSQYEISRRRELCILIVLTIVEVISLFLIDRLACKNMYAEIKKLKQDIAIREEKLRKRKEKQAKNDS